MDYTTYFTLYVDEEVDIKKVFEVGVSIDPNFSQAFEGSGHPNEWLKWDDHEEVMRKVSNLFPDTLIMVEGQGDDSYDRWRKYFKNGKMQYCPLTFAEFNEDKLR